MKYKKFPFKRNKKTLFHGEGDQALEQVPQRGRDVSTLGDIQNLTGHSHEQPAVGNLTLSRGLDSMISGGAFPPQSLCDSVKIKSSHASRDQNLGFDGG